MTNRPRHYKPHTPTQKAIRQAYAAQAPLGSAATLPAKPKRPVLKLRTDGLHGTDGTGCKK